MARDEMSSVQAACTKSTRCLTSHMHSFKCVMLHQNQKSIVNFIALPQQLFVCLQFNSLLVAIFRYRRTCAIAQFHLFNSSFFLHSNRYSYSILSIMCSHLRLILWLLVSSQAHIWFVVVVVVCVYVSR